MGTNAKDVEEYLQTVLLLGKTWGCVVLLDEADVFLMQRSIENFERNALVSVFLRVLEYYDGFSSSQAIAWELLMRLSSRESSCHCTTHR